MDAGIISVRYARAIYEYAAEKGNETLLYQEMKELAKHFSDCPALRKVMNDPTVVAEDKTKLLTTACGTDPDETTQHVVRLVVENGRADYMESIARMYDQVYRKAKGIVIVHLTTVEPANEETKNALVSVISPEKGEKVEFHTETDPDIIGGFILEIEDKRLDASVKEQLRIINYEL